MVLLSILLRPFQLGPIHVQRDDVPQDVPGLRKRRQQRSSSSEFAAPGFFVLKGGIAAAGIAAVEGRRLVVGGTPPGLILNGRLVVGLVDPAKAPRVRVRCGRKQCIKVGDKLKTTSKRVKNVFVFAACSMDDPLFDVSLLDFKNGSQNKFNYKSGGKKTIKIKKIAARPTRQGLLVDASRWGPSADSVTRRRSS